MRIAMVTACPFPAPQGSQVLVAQLSERLARAGHDVHLVTYGQGEDVMDRGFRHHRARRLPGDDASRSGPSLVKPVLDVLVAAELARTLAAADFDVVHCHNYEAAIVGLAVRLRYPVPVLYHSHNLMADELATYMKGSGRKRVAGRVGRWLDAQVPRRADHVIALCDHSAAVLRARGVRAEALSVVPPAVEDDGPAMPAAAARRRLGLDPSPGWIGYCGNLDGYQNLAVLLDALAILVERTGAGRRPPRMLVATHAPDASFLAAVNARALERHVHLVRLGSYEDARVAMAAADVLVLPRRHGSGYPIKLLNYLATARPVVTTGCGAKVLRSGVDGLVVGDDHPQALARALDSVLGAPELGRQLGEAGRRRYLRDLTWDAVLPAIESCYERCARAKALSTRSTRYNVVWRHR